MIIKLRQISLLIAMLAIIFSPFISSEILNPFDFMSSIFFVDSTTTQELHNKYNSDKKIKILIVPGHDESSGGTVYKKIKESEINLMLAKELYYFLSDNPLFNVYLYRDELGKNIGIENYIKANASLIDGFIKSKKDLMQKLIEAGDISLVEGVVHNTAPENTAKTLYGINKWANDNKVDLVVHIHFNDYPGRKMNQRGKYSGFAIYIPESQYSNASASKELSSYILKNLNHFYSKSNMPKENKGIVEDQELIALGSYNTLDGTGILIEYGYIYESQFTDQLTQKEILKDMAYQTYLGITNFFDKEKYNSEYWKSTLLPNNWSRNLDKGDRGSDVLSLQAALVLEGFYPPKDYSPDECPVTGKYGDCTVEAIKDFQERYGIKTTGVTGPKTLEKLNELYSKETGD